MNTQKFKNEIKHALDKIEEKSDIEYITDYYQLKVIRDLTDLSTAYTSNKQDKDHPRVKAAFSTLRDDSFKFFASCININKETNQTEDEFLDDLANNIVNESSLYDANHLKNIIDFLDTQLLQTLVLQLLTLIFTHIQDAEDDEAESNAIFELFNAHTLVQYFLWQEV